MHCRDFGGWQEEWDWYQTVLDVPRYPVCRLMENRARRFALRLASLPQGDGAREITGGRGVERTNHLPGWELVTENGLWYARKKHCDQRSQ